MSHLSETTAIATLAVIDQYLPADFDTLGITPEEFQLISSPLPWRRDYMPRLVRTMNALIFGSCEVMMLPKITVPAEYVAAVISACVNPANTMSMCIIMSQERATGVGALELAARGQQSSTIDPCSADQLFALCNILESKDRANYARMALKEKLGIRIDNALKGLN